jgi:hypothetical protein
MPSPPPSKQGKLTTELSSKSDVTHQETLRGEDTLNGTILAVAGEIFGRRDVEAAYADHSSGETRSPQPSKQDEPAADLSSKSDDHTHQDIRRGGGLPNVPSLAVADEIFGRRDVGAAYADHSIGEMPSPPPSKQDDPAAELFSKSDGNTHQQTLRGDDTLNGLSLAVADKNFGQRDVEAAYADHSSGETPSPPPPSERGEPAAVTIYPEERSAPDPTADFFSVDMERAVEMVRRKLGGESYNNDPGLVEVGELSDPTEDFLSVDEERAVGIVRREFGREDYLLDPGPVAAGELPDPTKDFFSVDVDRAVEMVRRALEKGAL